MKNQADLIVVLNEKLNLITLKESSLKRVPIISLNANYNLSDLNLSTYKVTGDFSFVKKPIRNNFFFLLLSSLLKKAERLKKQQIQRKKENKKKKGSWKLTNSRTNVFKKKK